MTSYTSAIFAKKWSEAIKQLDGLCEFIGTSADRECYEDDFLFEGDKLFHAVVTAEALLTECKGFVWKLHEYTVERERSAGIKEELITKLERF